MLVYSAKIICTEFLFHLFIEEKVEPCGIPNLTFPQPEIVSALSLSLYIAVLIYLLYR